MAIQIAANNSAVPESEELTFPCDPPIKITATQKKLQMQAKRDAILKLAVRGYSVREIADQMETDGWKGCGRSNIGKLLKLALDGGAKELTLQAKHHVALELEKMRGVERAHLDKLVNAGTADDIDKLCRALSRIWTRRDNLLGLNKPQVVEHTGKDGAPIETTTRVIMPAAIEEETAEA